MAARIVWKCTGRKSDADDLETKYVSSLVPPVVNLICPRFGWMDRSLITCPMHQVSLEEMKTIEAEIGVLQKMVSTQTEGVIADCESVSILVFNDNFEFYQARLNDLTARLRLMIVVQQ